MELAYLAAGTAATFLPNVWGHGMLFAYSGLDGLTSWERPLVASGGPLPGQLRFRYPADTDLFLSWSYKGQSYGNRDAAACPPCTVQLAASDAADLEFRHDDESRLRLSFVFADKDRLLGRLAGEGLTAPLAASLRLAAASGDRGETLGGELEACDRLRLVWPEARAADGNLSRDVPEDGATYFLVTLDPAAEAADAGEFETAWEARLSFFAGLPEPAVPEGADAELVRRTYYKAWSVIKVNQESAQGAIPYHWTTPDRYPHRHMWLWDTVFQSFPLARIAPDKAAESLLAVLEGQHDSGMISHWGRPDGRRSDMTQPPILAWGVWETYAAGGSRAFLESAYPRLAAFLLWMQETMDTNGNGLAEWVRGGCESGLDNSPRFDDDELFDAVDLNAFLAHDCACLAQIAEVVAPAEAAGWSARAAALNTRLNEQLWHEADGIYHDRKVDGRWQRLKTCVAFLPLLSGAPSAQQARRLVRDHLFAPASPWGALPVASVATDEAVYEKDMWRGPTWLNVDYAILCGLRRYGYDAEADALARRIVDEVARWYAAEGVLFEYYDAEAAESPRRLFRKGKRGGAHWINSTICDYHWSAAVIAMALLPRG